MGSLLETATGLIHQPPFVMGDDTNGRTRFELNGVITFEDDACVFEDLNISALCLKCGLVSPDVEVLDGTSIAAYVFSGAAGHASDVLHGSFELPHSYKLESDIVPHIHWCPTEGSGGDVKLFMEYAWINAADVIGSGATLSAVVAAGTTAWQLNKTDLGALDGTGTLVGSQFVFRIYRDPDDAEDTYAYPVALTNVGIHFKRDTVGSRTISTK